MTENQKPTAEGLADMILDEAINRPSFQTDEELQAEVAKAIRQFGDHEWNAAIDEILKRIRRQFEENMKSRKPLWIQHEIESLRREVK